MIAILPAAGLGTRMTSVTNGAAKEGLMLGGKSILARVIEEGFAAGASTCVVVSSPRKPELNAMVSAMDRVTLMMQTEPLGLAHAIAAADAEGDALVLLPDTVFSGGCAACRLNGLGGFDGGILVEEVPEHAVSSYGIVDVSTEMSILNLVEKPLVSDSRLAIAARYFFGARLMEFVSTRVREGDLELTDILKQALGHGFALKAIPASGLVRHDCGSPASYFEAKEVFSCE